MAERVGASGHVLVTDIEPRFIERSARHWPAHIELRRHDIGIDPLPERAFDLIHARLVLQHVPQRHQALASLVAALKPRGWLVIEEFDGRMIDRSIPTANAADAERFSKMVRALARLMDERGFEADWPRRLHQHLRAAGLVEVDMEGHLAVREGGSPASRLDAANFAQVRKEAVDKGLITVAEVDMLLERLASRDFAVFSPLMFTACGRAP
jgi:SAM-dependent methyltransferase